MGTQRECEMTGKEQSDKTNELLEKLIILTLYNSGASQDVIAQFLGKSKTTINEVLKPLGKRNSK